MYLYGKEKREKRMVHRPLGALADVEKWFFFALYIYIYI